MEEITYTIVEPEGDEVLLDIAYDDVGGYDGVPAKPVAISIGTLQIHVQPQQLMELGALFLDFESIDTVSLSESNVSFVAEWFGNYQAHDREVFTFPISMLADQSRIIAYFKQKKAEEQIESQKEAKLNA